MDHLERYDLEKLSRHLSLKIVEALETSFVYHGRNRHAFNRIFLVIKADKNSQSYIHNHTTGQHLPMHAGNIYFMPCSTDLEFNFCSDMRFLSFHFYLELFGNFEFFSLENRSSSIKDNGLYIPELSGILHEEYSLALQYRLNGLVTMLASEFMDRASGKTIQLDFITGKYGRLFEYIATDADATTSIDDLSEVIKMPRDKLSREFSKDCDITLKHYQAQMLIRRAESLLLAPGATSRSVAEKLNFTSEYYFSRFFKKHTGRTAGQYRKENGENIA